MVIWSVEKVLGWGVPQSHPLINWIQPSLQTTSCWIKMNQAHLAFFKFIYDRGLKRAQGKGVTVCHWAIRISLLWLWGNKSCWEYLRQKLCNCWRLIISLFQNPNFYFTLEEVIGWCKTHFNIRQVIKFTHWNLEHLYIWDNNLFWHCFMKAAHSSIAYLTSNSLIYFHVSKCSSS